MGDTVSLLWDLRTEEGRLGGGPLFVVGLKVLALPPMRRVLRVGD